MLRLAAAETQREAEAMVRRAALRMLLMLDKPLLP
jgi:hypothetical protein